MSKTSKIENVSSEDKLNALNKEITELYAKYKKDGLTNEKLTQKILPISQIAKLLTWKLRAQRFLYVCIVIAAIGGISQWNVSSKAISVIYKKSMVNYVSYQNCKNYRYLYFANNVFDVLY